VSANVTALSLDSPLAAEDQARAGHYALLARLYSAGPDAALLAAIAGADEIAGEEPSTLAGAWRALAAAARTMDAEAAALEYDEVFVGTGKAEVTPYATHYLSETGREKILVRLKQDLVFMELARAAGRSEPEDHFATLFEVMRHLVMQGIGDAASQQQRDFFTRYIERSFPTFCDAVLESGKSNFYRHVARFMRAYLEVERESLKVF
jgi:TorA maturation chaperone TorD